MKKKPLSLKLIALAYLIAPIGNVLQIAYFNHWPLKGPRSVFNHLSNYEWMVLAFFPIVAYGIWRVAKWGYFLCLGFAAFLIVQNTYALFVNDSYSPYVVLLFQLVSFAIAGLFVQKHIAAPYFNPNMRWWESDPRYKVDFKAQARMGQTHMKCAILDVSMGGCFVELKKALKLDDLIWIHLSFEKCHVTALSKIVWVKPGEIKGYGLMFVSMEKSDETSLHQLIKDLKKSYKKSIAQKHQKDDSILSA